MGEAQELRRVAAGDEISLSRPGRTQTQLTSPPYLLPLSPSTVLPFFSDLCPAWAWPQGSPCPLGNLSTLTPAWVDGWMEERMDKQKSHTSPVLFSEASL